MIEWTWEIQAIACHAPAMVSCYREPGYGAFSLDTEAMHNASLSEENSLSHLLGILLCALLGHPFLVVHRDTTARTN